MATSPVARRLAIAGVCLLSLVLCCGLAWWQWEKFSSANGTFQNLGYVLQWPLFGLFPAFMFWRIRQLRLRAEAAPPQEPQEPAKPVRLPEPRVSREQPADPEDAELAAYNAYLAELAARDEESRK
ncbi:hypothetical protein [Amycolatopsis magusensis]|uniref:DNA-binding transcriptional regulator of glucitol operon n=1 Tax=Amycolatopsis magusensis TaxID=882444 RepID=A0ABS4Q2Q5_9PSEU|nr:hypothetical protein [Amycolatopsis magusensis]MBP2185972.1 DNA-binding transcriptional regulator of glucitol operon [Amycolatopsis magusensis]